MFVSKALNLHYRKLDLNQIQVLIYCIYLKFGQLLDNYASSCRGVMNTSIKNVERCLKQLKNGKKVEFKGSSKTGGYYAK